jgi:hypothetical protein
MVMKKWAFILLVLVLPAASTRAQSIADDITQLLLDVQKLSELKQILADMYKGYTIVKDGYENIKGLSQGTFSLHKAFLDGLLAVSPVVRDYAKVLNIINNEAELVKEYKDADHYFRASGHFTAAELDYISGLYLTLVNASLRNLDELTMVITAGELRMNDAERLSAIDRIDKDIGDKLNFLREFNSGSSLQGVQRARDNNDIGTMKAIYGIPK